MLALGYSRYIRLLRLTGLLSLSLSPAIDYANYAPSVMRPSLSLSLSRVSIDLCVRSLISLAAYRASLQVNLAFIIQLRGDHHSEAILGQLGRVDFPR